MKRIFLVFLISTVIAGTFFLTNCKSTESTMGTLTITAVMKDSSSSAPFLIYIANSSADLNNKVYRDSSWTNSNGSTIFRNLKPQYYWYRAKGWDDFGASEAFSGFDESVILWLNSPSKP